MVEIMRDEADVETVWTVKQKKVLIKHVDRKWKIKGKVMFKLTGPL